MQKGKTVVVFAGLRIKDEFCQEFAQRAKSVVDNTRKEQGCIKYDLLRDVYSPDTFFFFEEHKDEAAFAAHRSMPYMDEFRKYRAGVVAEYLGVATLDRVGMR